MPCGVYTSNYSSAVEEWLIKNTIYIKAISMQANNQQDFTTESLVCLLIYFFMRLNHWNLGTRWVLTILQQSVRYSCSSSWPASQVLTKTIEATYLPLNPESRQTAPWIFALPSGMAFNAVDRLVCCSRLGQCTVQRLTLFLFFPFPFLVFPWITSEFLLQMMNQLGQCKCVFRKKILLGLIWEFRRVHMIWGWHYVWYYYWS